MARRGGQPAAEDVRVGRVLQGQGLADGFTRKAPLQQVEDLQLPLESPKLRAVWIHRQGAIQELVAVKVRALRP